MICKSPYRQLATFNFVPFSAPFEFNLDAARTTIFAINGNRYLKRPDFKKDEVEIIWPRNIICCTQYTIVAARPEKLKPKRQTWPRNWVVTSNINWLQRHLFSLRG